MSTAARSHTPRLAAVPRSEERVTPLELFFDLVFVLALTQCTALMAADPTWGRLAQGLLILGLLWWSWVGYAWLTNVVNPEEGAVRFAIFAAMAALLVTALCVLDAFGDSALLFACAYAAVRLGQIALFMLASRDDTALRHSVIGLAGGTSVGVGLVVVGALFENDTVQAAFWALALLLDMGEPDLFGSEGWKLAPSHVAFRWRNVHRFSIQRLACAIVLCALIPAATELDALVTLAIVAALLAALIAYETVHFAELRDRLRHQLAGEPGQGSSA